MSTRAERLMQSLGSKVPQEENNLGSDGSISQLGAPPDREILSKENPNTWTCPSCGFSGISLKAKICPECGNKKPSNESWDDRAKKVKRTLVEGKNNKRIEEAVDTIITVLNFAGYPSEVCESGTVMEELRGRVTEVLFNFEEWLSSQNQN